MCTLMCHTDFQVWAGMTRWDEKSFSNHETGTLRRKSRFMVVLYSFMLFWIPLQAVLFQLHILSRSQAWNGSKSEVQTVPRWILKWIQVRADGFSFFESSTTEQAYSMFHERCIVNNHFCHRGCLTNVKALPFSSSKPWPKWDITGWGQEECFISKKKTLQNPKLS